METAHRRLKPHGLFLLHTIGTMPGHHLVHGLTSIFPRRHASSVAQLSAAMDGLLVMEIGTISDPTMTKRSWPGRTMWTSTGGNLRQSSTNGPSNVAYYLLSLAGSFRARKIHLCNCDVQAGCMGGYDRCDNRHDSQQEYAGKRERGGGSHSLDERGRPARRLKKLHPSIPAACAGARAST